MTDLLSAGQVVQIREAMRDIADTFAFPIEIVKTSYTEGAFESVPNETAFPLTAIRDFGSAGEQDRYRSALGPAATHEFDLFIGWQAVTDAGLIGANSLPLLDHNDLVRMEGEFYEIVAFAGVADMTKEPCFLQLRVKRRFANPNGASAI